MKTNGISLLIIALAVHFNVLAQTFNWVNPIHYYAGPPGFPGSIEVPGGLNSPMYPRIASDNSNNLYLAGSHRDTIYVEGIRTFTNNYYDGFIIKYTSDGDVVWLTRITGAHDQRISDIDTDSNGNIYVTGTYVEGASFGTTDVTGTGMFIAKYTPAGNLDWLKHVAGVQAVYPNRLVLQNDKIFIGGSLTAEPVNFGCASMSQEDGSKFVAVYNTSGDCQNVYSFDAAYLNDIAVDNNNNVYVTGGFIEAATFGTIELEAEFQDYYLARMNANGTWSWANQMATEAYAGMGTEVEGSPTGEIIFAGYFKNTADFGGIELTSVEAADIFLASYDDFGNLQWVSTGTGNGNQYAFAMSVDQAGDIFLSGSIIDDTQFGNFSITTDSERTFFAHYAANGGCLGVTSVSGTQGNRGADLLARNGIAYLAVDIFSQGTFSFDEISHTAKASDVFATQLSYPTEVILGAEKNELSQVTVYPNPFDSELTIDFGTTDSRETIITVKNTLGQTVALYRPQLQEGKSLIESPLPPGVYFVSIVKDNKSVIRKVVKN